MLGRLSLYLGLVAAVVGGVLYDRWLVPSGTTVSFLSVGQGDCTVLMSDGWTVLIDTGPKTPFFDGGERLVVPELRRLGVRKIDCIVITHPDADHIGGLEAVARRYRIGRVVVSAAFQDDEKMLGRLEDAGVRLEQVVWVDSFAEARLGDLRLQFVAPQFEPGASDNDLSLFVRVDAGEGSIAIIGDAGFDEESALSVRSDWDVDLLLAGHHGSATSTGREWLVETSPDVVIVSCGRRNQYGHPSPEVVSRVEAYGAELLRTDRDGTVTFVLTESGFERATR